MHNYSDTTLCPIVHKKKINNKLSFKSETSYNIPRIEFLNENYLSFKKVFLLDK